MTCEIVGVFIAHAWVFFNNVFNHSFFEAQNNLNYDPNERSGDILPAMIHAFLNNNLYYTRGHVAQRHENRNLKSKQV